MEKILKSKKASSVKNLVIGIVYQIINLVLSFVCRTFLIKKLGTEILGINSLYSNILTVLSLAELGISNVMQVMLYKPIVEDDKEKITAYINYYRKIYHIIVLVITLLGVIIIPFLNSIISSDILLSSREVISYYLIFLLNTLISYIAVYKQSLLNANQEFYIVKTFNLIHLVLKSILGISILIIFENYALYLISECTCNLILNLSLSFYVDKRYKFIKTNYDAKLDISAKKELLFNVKDTFLYKIGSVLITNTDSIVVSVMIGTVAVGYLANYNLIITALNGIITIITGAIFASVGNLAIENNPKKSNKVFNVVLGVYHYIGAFFGIGLFCCFNDFILLWLKSSEYLLDSLTVIALSINFYFMTAITPIYIFRENYGLFNKAKYYLLMAAVVNIIASVLLVKLFGLGGVILGTIVCRLVTTFILEPPYLYKKAFNRSAKNYYFRQLIMMVVSICAFAICIFVCGLLDTSWLNFIFKILICFCVVTGLYCVFFWNTDEFKYLKSIFKDIFIKIGLVKPNEENKNNIL